MKRIFLWMKLNISEVLRLTVAFAYRLSVNRGYYHKFKEINTDCNFNLKVHRTFKLLTTYNTIIRELKKYNIGCFMSGSTAYKPFLDQSPDADIDMYLIVLPNTFCDFTQSKIFRDNHFLAKNINRIFRNEYDEISLKFELKDVEVSMHIIKMDKLLDLKKLNFNDNIEHRILRYRKRPNGKTFYTGSLSGEIVSYNLFISNPNSTDHISFVEPLIIRFRQNEFIISSTLNRILVSDFYYNCDQILEIKKNILKEIRQPAKRYKYTNNIHYLFARWKLFTPRIKYELGNEDY